MRREIEHLATSGMAVTPRYISLPAYSSSMLSRKFSITRARRTFMVAVNSPSSMLKSRPSTR